MAHLWDKGESRQFKAFQSAKNRYDAEHQKIMDLVAKKGAFYERIEHKNLSKAPTVHVAAPTGVEAPMYPVRGRMAAPRQTAARIAVPRADEAQHHAAPAGITRGRGRPPIPALPAAAPAAPRHTKEEIAVIKHAMRLSGRSRKEANLLYKENREVPTVAAARDVIRAHLAPPKEKKAPKKKTKEAGVGMEREERPTKEAGVDVRPVKKEMGLQTTEKIVSQKEAKKEKAGGQVNAMAMMWAIIKEAPGTTKANAMKEAHARIKAME